MESHAFQVSRENMKSRAKERGHPATIYDNDSQDKTLIFSMSLNKCTVHSHLEFRSVPASTKIHRKTKENTEKNNRIDQR